jgi:ribosomal protein S6--L-glutamate ligase
MVIEVKSSPGLEGIEKATGIDVAGAMIAFVEEHCQMPFVDVRQRLTMAAGHSVIELVVSEKSALVGTQIGDSALMGGATRVLTVSRAGVLTALPPDDFAMAAGDELLIFGPTEALRVLLPSRGKPRKKQPVP